MKKQTKGGKKDVRPCDLGVTETFERITSRKDNKIDSYPNASL